MKRNTTPWSTAAAIAVAVIIALTPLASYAEGAGSQNHIVEIQDFRFSPAELTVAPGDTITWINKDIVPHTATANDRGWDSGTVGNEGQWRMTVEKGQDGTYFCRFHPSMVGRIIIAER